MLSAPSSHNVSVCSQGMRNIIWAVTIELLSWLLRELQHLKLAAILGQGGCFNAGLCKKKTHRGWKGFVAVNSVSRLGF